MQRIATVYRRMLHAGLGKLIELKAKRTPMNFLVASFQG